MQLVDTPLQPHEAQVPETPLLVVGTATASILSPSPYPGRHGGLLRLVPPALSRLRGCRLPTQPLWLEVLS